MKGERRAHGGRLLQQPSNPTQGSYRSLGRTAAPVPGAARKTVYSHGSESLVKLIKVQGSSEVWQFYMGANLIAFVLIGSPILWLIY